MSLDNPLQHKVARFSRGTNIKEKPEILRRSDIYNVISGHAHFFLGVIL